MNHGPIIANKLSLRLMMGPSINLIDSPFTNQILMNLMVSLNDKEIP